MKKVFSGKKALVIGGSGGIGKAVSLDLARRGAELVIHGGSSRERLDNTLEEIRESDGNAKGFLLAINGPEAAQEIVRHLPSPDILVCAWGPFQRGRLETLDQEFWQHMVMGNLIFPGLLVSLVLPEMMKKKWGRILLFGGTNTDTIRGYFSSAAYSAAKTGLGVIAKSTARAVAGLAEKTGGITCNVICPGLTDTEYLSGEALQYNREKSPGNVTLEPSVVSGFCMAVLENQGINGAVIPVDSGICL